MNFNSIASISRIINKWTGKSIPGALKFELLILCRAPRCDCDRGTGGRWMISYCRQDLLADWTWETLTEPLTISDQQQTVQTENISIFHPGDSSSSSQVSLKFKDKLSPILSLSLSFSLADNTNINLDWKEEWPSHPPSHLTSYSKVFITD